MVCCLNPQCKQPLNPDINNFCEQCGARLIPLRRRFQIVRLLGKGLFGNTYLAKDGDNLNAPCVVKQLRNPAQDTGGRQTVAEPFLQTIEQLRQLQKNQHIPSILAYFEEDSLPYLVQEYIDGQNLQQLIEDQGPFNEQQIRSLLLELLPVLQSIHDQGVMHRDLKPAHILRQHRDKQLLLVGFSVYQQSHPSQLPPTVSVRDDTSYAPPEPFATNQVHPGSDLYSLGTSCIHLLTGAAPHALPLQEGEVWVTHWPKHLSQPLSPGLQAILDRLIQTDISQKYRSALEVCRELRTLTTQTKKTLPPPPPAPQPPPSQSSSRPQGTAAHPVSLPEESPSNPSIHRLSRPLSFPAEIVKVNPQGQITDRQQQEIDYITEDLGQGVTLDLVVIPSGQFSMGSPPAELHRQPPEGPQHSVAIPQFYMGKFPVTQAQWRAVAALPVVKRELDIQPSAFTGDQRPVERVSWFDVVEFCSRLSLLTGKDYQLPSEAAWEYACRADSTTPFAFGETLTTDIANYDGTAGYGSGPIGKHRQQTTSVSKFPANPYGLYDMHGNVWEWCGDHWHDNYGQAPGDGSVWQDQFFFACVLRGGAWNTPATSCRSATRIWETASEQSHNIGFRVARILTQPATA